MHRRLQVDPLGWPRLGDRVDMTIEVHVLCSWLLNCRSKRRIEGDRTPETLFDIPSRSRRSNSEEHP